MARLENRIQKFQLLDLNELSINLKTTDKKWSRKYIHIKKPSYDPATIQSHRKGKVLLEIKVKYTEKQLPHKKCTWIMFSKIKLKTSELAHYGTLGNITPGRRYWQLIFSVNDKMVLYALCVILLLCINKRRLPSKHDELLYIGCKFQLVYLWMLSMLVFPCTLI